MFCFCPVQLEKNKERKKKELQLLYIQPTNFKETRFKFALFLA